MKTHYKNPTKTHYKNPTGSVELSSIYLRAIVIIDGSTTVIFAVVFVGSPHLHVWECVGLGYERGRDLRKEMERHERKREGETVEIREILMEIILIK